MTGYIPYGADWSTPLVRWQGAFAHVNANEFAADVARGGLFQGCAAGDSAMAALVRLRA